jgi:SH3 domain-containing YSC84-like protein 1
MKKPRSVLWTIKSSLIIALLIGILGFAVPAPADDATDSRHLADTACIALENFVNASEMQAFRDLLKSARGIFIAPQILKGAFIVGAAGGSGVFLARGATPEQWLGPAFYTMGGASFGFQIGGQASEVVLLAMTDRGVSAFLGNSVRLGADIGIATGPVGIGAAASTQNFSVDILSFARSKGLFGGVSLDGAIVAVRSGWNQAYYNKPNVTPADILVKKSIAQPQSERLIEVLGKAGIAR